MEQKKSPLRGAWEFTAAVARRFVEDRGMQTAGSLTFTTLLAMVPLATVALALSTAFPVFDEAMTSLQLFVFENFLPDTGELDALTDHIIAFTESAGRLTTIGLVFLVLTAVMLMLTIDDALNRIFRVRRKRPLAQRILTYWSVLTLGPVLIGSSLSMTSFVIGASFGVLSLGAVAEFILRLLPYLFTWGALTLLYILVPYRHVSVRHALIGGLLGGVAFEVAKRGFAAYLSNFPTYTLLYGAFATLPIFLLWIYVSWVVVLIGANFTALAPGYHVITAEHDRPPGRELTEALDVLAVLAHAQNDGKVLPLEFIARQAGVMPYRCETLLERCAGMGWAAKTERDSWVLARDADTIRVADVYRSFVLDPGVTGERLAEHWKHVDTYWGTSLRELHERNTVR
jgi:membrane protein